MIGLIQIDQNYSKELEVCDWSEDLWSICINIASLKLLKISLEEKKELKLSDYADYVVLITGTSKAWLTFRCKQP